MSSSLDAAKTKEAIIEIYQGNGLPEECPMSRLDQRDANIKKKFSEMGYFRKASPIDKSLIYLKCMKLNHLEIIKSLVAFTLLGSVCGGIIGAAGNAPGAAGGAAIGGGIGGAAGAYYCWHRGLYNKEEHIVSVIKDSTEYSKFKAQRTPEQYQLFIAFFKNYCSHIDDKYAPRIADFTCNITYDVPEYPVFSPYDIDRKTPYEKAEIEKHLDIIEKEVQDYKKSCENSFPKISDEEIEKHIISIKQRSDPLGGPPFTKQELVYDPEFCKSVIITLKNIQKDLLTKLPRDEDPVILKGVNALIDHYSQNYQAVTQSLIKSMSRDIFAIDGDIELANDASNKISKILMKV